MPPPAPDEPAGPVGPAGRRARPGRRRDDQPGRSELGAAGADHAGHPAAHDLAGRRAARRRRPVRPDREPVRRALAGLFGLAVTVGLPLLLGLVVRTTRELGRQAEVRAEAERRRRESESRAARADERGAIARELHDVLAHHVASMVLRVGVARHVLPDLDPRVGEVFDDVHATGTAALTDLRRLVAVLRDPDGVAATPR
ncbi:histidine kinase dimerization/phosphoacceptor domain-containing protein [Micromonospora sp. BRA006-A]|nr:histidine kinase dimerization/phosphoacceptor domain-containing protein [Micromonospora sp. BRA006-A]